MNTSTATKPKKKWTLTLGSGEVLTFTSFPKLRDSVQQKSLSGKVYRGQQLYCSAQNGVFT